MTTRISRTLAAGLAAAGLATAAVAFTGSGNAGAAEPVNPPKVIVVNGTGKVTVKPDMAVVNLGATATAEKATEALAKMNEASAKVLEALKAAGIAEDDIATSSLNLSTNFGQDNRVTGFTASNMVEVKIRDIAKAGSVIDAVAAAAGDNVAVQGISFGIADPESKLTDARKAAVANAKKHADELAAAAGTTVGAVIQISEVGVYAPAPMLTRMESAAADAKVSVMPGTQDLTVSVTVTYGLGS